MLAFPRIMSVMEKATKVWIAWGVNLWGNHPKRCNDLFQCTISLMDICCTRFVLFRNFRDPIVDLQVRANPNGDSSLYNCWRSLMIVMAKANKRLNRILNLFGHPKRYNAPFQCTKSKWHWEYLIVELPVSFVPQFSWPNEEVRWLMNCRSGAHPNGY